MNGVHDMGGMHGFGPVEAEPETTEPVFHADWERQTAGVLLALTRQGHWSIDRFRKTIEGDAPANYLSSSYYERWLRATEALVVECGLATPEELADGKPAAASSPPATASTWSPTFETADPPRYQAGDRVRAANRHPTGHTRLPRYVRGRTGVVINHAGAEPLPELAAEGVDQPRNLYMVRFEATELWGHEHTARDAIYLELWDDYLEPA